MRAHMGTHMHCTQQVNMQPPVHLQAGRAYPHDAAGLGGRRVGRYRVAVGPDLRANVARARGVQCACVAGGGARARMCGHRAYVHACVCVRARICM